VNTGTIANDAAGPNSVRRYLESSLAGDLAAGFSVAAVSVPIVFAYAGLTGLPIQSGFYTAIFAAIAYALFSASRVIAGPDTATCIMVGATLTAIGTAGTGDRSVDAAILALLVGIACFAASLLRLGAIANFLSKPILLGYMVGIAASLFVGQYHNLTALKIASNGVIRPTIELLGKLNQAHMPTLITGLTLFVVARLMKWLSPGLPRTIVVLVLGIGASWLFDLPHKGVAIVGDIQLTLPHIPKTLHLSNAPVLILDALGIAVVSFAAGIVTARSFATRLNEAVDPNQVLRGFGAANIAAGLALGYPVSGADSRTAMVVSAGGRTRMTAIFAALALVLLTLVLHRPLAILPMAALGAILASAAVDLVDFETLWRTRRVSPFELLLGLFTAAGVVALGVMNGVMIAVGASIMHLLWYASTPGESLLGTIPGRPGLYDLAHEGVEPFPGILIFRLEGSPLFFNAAWLRQRALLAAADYTHPFNLFLLDARMMATMDSTAQDEIIALADALREHNIRFVLAGGGKRFREIVKRGGIAEAIGQENVFETVSAALYALGKGGTPLDEDSND
jgi:high affinity sulfate transporter 1